MAAVFLLILVHLLMRAAYDIENSLGDDETLGARLCSAMLRQGVQFSTPYILYANGSGYTIKGIRDQIFFQQCAVHGGWHFGFDRRFRNVIYIFSENGQCPPVFQIY